MQRSVAWFVRFKKHLLLRFGKSRQGQASLITGPLKVNEVVDASEEIVRLVQRDSRLLAPFSNKSASRSAKLNPVVDKGIVRVGGRLDNAPLGSELKYPVILPSEHHATRLIVRYLHESDDHSGTNQTMAAVRQHYWIIRGPSTVKRVVSGCISCRG